MRRTITLSPLIEANLFDREDGVSSLSDEQALSAADFGQIVEFFRFLKRMRDGV